VNQAVPPDPFARQHGNWAQWFGSDWPLVRAAAFVKARHRLSYADAFCVATAQRMRAPLWTGDPEILALGDELEVVDLR